MTYPRRVGFLSGKMNRNGDSGMPTSARRLAKEHQWSISDGTFRRECHLSMSRLRVGRERRPSGQKRPSKNPHGFPLDILQDVRRQPRKAAYASMRGRNPNVSSPGRQYVHVRVRLCFVARMRTEQVKRGDTEPRKADSVCFSRVMTSSRRMCGKSGAGEESRVLYQTRKRCHPTVATRFLFPRPEASISRRRNCRGIPRRVF